MKKMAVTIDDLPFVSKRASIEEIEEATEALLGHLKRAGVNVVGFVNGRGICVENEENRRSNLLGRWQEEGHLLGNHTFSHLSFNDTPIEIFKKDIVKNERILKPFWNSSSLKEHYFRFPYLHNGPDGDYKSIERFLLGKSYTIVPITVNSHDFVFNAVYADAFFKGDDNLMRYAVSAYLAYLNDIVKYREQFLFGIMGRPVSQIILLHANPINSCCLDRVINVLNDQNYHFTPLNQTLQDSIYRAFRMWTPKEQKYYKQWVQKGMPAPENPLPKIDGTILKLYRLLCN